MEVCFAYCFAVFSFGEGLGQEQMVFESHAGKNYIDELGFEVLECFFQAAALAVNTYFMFQ